MFDKNPYLKPTSTDMKKSRFKHHGPFKMLLHSSAILSKIPAIFSLDLCTTYNENS